MKIGAIVFLLFVIEVEIIQAESALSFQWPECDPEIVSWHSHPSTCTKYVICFYGNYIIMPCAPGFHFSPHLKKCMEPEKAKCDISYACPKEDDELNPVFLADPKDCSSYFVCYKGDPIPKSCSENLWWDVDNNWCTYADRVTCDSRVPNNPNSPDEVPTAASNFVVIFCLSIVFNISISATTSDRPVLIFVNFT